MAHCTQSALRKIISIFAIIVLMEFNFKFPKIAAAWKKNINESLLWSEEPFCKMNNYPWLNLFCIFHFAVSGFVQARN